MRIIKDGDTDRGNKVMDELLSLTKTAMDDEEQETGNQGDSNNTGDAGEPQR